MCLLYCSGLAYISLYKEVMGVNFLEPKYSLTRQTFQSTKQKNIWDAGIFFGLDVMLRFLGSLFWNVCCIAFQDILFSSFYFWFFILSFQRSCTRLFFLNRKVFLYSFGVRIYFFISLWYAVLFRDTLTTTSEGNCQNHLQDLSQSRVIFTFLNA